MPFAGVLRSLAVTGIDTNIIVRLLTGDDKQQFQQAKKIFSDHQVFIADTVILETEWVLRFAYNFDANAIDTALLKLLGLPNVHVSSPARLAKVLQLHNVGLDFADAMHLMANQSQDTFLTFDKAFIRRAKNMTVCTVKEPQITD